MTAAATLFSIALSHKGRADSATHRYSVVRAKVIDKRAEQQCQK
jgi:hypothetical protein